MAIKPTDGLSNNLSQSYNSTNSVDETRSPYCYVKLNFSADQSSCSTKSKCKNRKTNGLVSPYIVDGFHTTTKQKPINKKHPSSFPLAMNIYKANSDELNLLRRGNQKVKKSVLTLPNNPVPLPQVCTVSDMNDSEYFDHKAKKRVVKPKKRSLQTKKQRAKTKRYEYYDRDAQYCAQLSIDLDRSSTDIMHHNGDTRRKSHYKRSIKKLKEDNNTLEAHDVWTILRNMNRFQFQPSPPMSEESIMLPKKKNGFKYGLNHNNASVFETCHTEEIAYVTSYEIDRKSHNTYSPSSSDRITVIDKQNEISKAYEGFKGVPNLGNGRKEPPKARKQIRNDFKGTHGKANVPPKITTNNHVSHVKKRIQQRRLIDDDFPKISFDQKDTKSDHTSFTSNGNKCVTHEQAVVCEASYSILSPLDVGNDFVIPDGKRFRNVSSPQFKGISKVVVSKVNEADRPQKSSSPKNRLKNRWSTAITNTVTSTPIETQTENTRKDFSVQSSEHDIAEMHREAATNTEVPAACQRTHKNTVCSPNINKRSTYYNKFRAVKPINIDSKLSSNDMLTNLEPAKPDKPKLLHKIMSTKLVTAESRNMVTGTTKMKPAYEPDLTLKDANRAKSVNQTMVTKKISMNKVPQSTNDLKSATKEAVPKKPIILFKDRMLNFLHRQPSNVSDYNPRISSPSRNTIVAKVDVQNKRKPETYTNLRSDSTKSLIPTRIIPKQRWAKAKRASDFIENVIKKVKSGVYYTQDSKKSLDDESSLFSPETSIETAASIKSYSDAASDRVVCEDALDIMSNNNNALSAIEIRTLNSNQIAIKHCVTNVVLQFDVTIPSESSQILMNTKTSSTLIPLDSTESQSQVFKSKMTIVNAVLPAELCTIMPKMIRSFFDSNGKSTLPLQNYPLGLLKPDKPALSTIKEVTRCESPDPFKCLAISRYSSPKVKLLLEGGFAEDSQQRSKRPLKNKIYQIPYNSIEDARETLSKVCTKKLPVKSNIMLGTIKLPNYFETNGGRLNSLVPYKYAKHSVASLFMPYDFTNFIQNVMKNKLLLTLLRPVASINEIRMLYDGRNITVNMSVNDLNGNNKQMSLSVKNLNMDSLLSTEMNVNAIESDAKALKPVMKCLPALMSDPSRSPCKQPQGLDSAVSKYERKVQNTIVKKHRKKSFHNLHRKSKSSSYVSGEKGCTPLDKIKSLEDFLQILGSNKWLYTVFDDCGVNKILSAVLEMRNWITHINPRQAFLVLLLTTKKDTPNLVRFRPILLQGIAVNRITKVSELDMEIDVIEHENFQKFSQYDGIPCLPMSTEYYDNLMEELYWIAKTTASDYQKPFDDSSVRLLNSLLEKRKKLNPSYLRVMARYVGLGLLKAPKK